MPAWAQSPPSLASASAATQSVAEPYFKAYIARDWKALEPLLAESGKFSHPTAKLVFGAVEVSGKPQTMKLFRENYAAITSMRFNRTRAFFSGTHAVFEGTLDWTLRLEGGKLAVTTGMPFVTILRVENGQVVEHQDFADYQPFLAAHRKAASGG
jgi:ketosteroid isomerase-like protein